jgi:hypothetical protein
LVFMTMLATHPMIPPMMMAMRKLMRRALLPVVQREGNFRLDPAAKGLVTP